MCRNVSSRTLALKTRAGALLASLFLLAGMLNPVANVLAATTCDPAGSVGTAQKAFTIPTGGAGTYKAWLELQGSASATVGIEVLNNSCTKKTLSGIPSTFGWVDTGVAFDLGSGQSTFKLTAYSGGFSARNVMLIANENCVPKGDGSNCDTIITTPPAPTPAPAPAPTPTPTPPAAGTTLAPGTYDDKALSFSSGWIYAASGSGENKYSGSDYYSNTTGSTVTIKFKGTSVQVYGAKASWHGQMTTTLDGTASTSIDEYNTTRLDQVEIYSKSGLANAEHTLVLKVAGTKNATSTGTYVSVDKVVVSASTTPAPTPTPTPTPTLSPTPTPTVTAPNSPSNLRASQSKGWFFSNQINLTWDKPSGYKSTDKFEVSFAGKNSSTTTATSFRLDNALYDSTYEFWVTTVGSTGLRSAPAKLRVTVSCNWFFCSN